jgi:cell wall-associated NlpC family hydrolase
MNRWRSWPGKLKMIYGVLPVSILLLMAGCTARNVPYHPPPEARGKELARMAYTIQAGAFAKVENAARLTEVLRGQGVDATYFAAEKGLYKVRIGNYPSRTLAQSKAESLKQAGIIQEYYIVSPGEYTAARKGSSRAELGDELVKTARSFIDVPYLWGGTGVEGGFDCSGLTMTVYQLNGLDLPRTSLEQVEVGRPVARDRLAKGDLVFFHAKNGEKVSHVGVYAGDDLFIHAPGRGKKIRTDSLSGRYYRERFVGGRSYLQNF